MSTEDKIATAAAGPALSEGLGTTAPLVERLRDWADEAYELQDGELQAVRSDLVAAADEIVRLRTELFCAREDVKKWQGLAEVARTLHSMSNRRVERLQRLVPGS